MGAFMSEQTIERNEDEILVLDYSEELTDEALDRALTSYTCGGCR
jgi:hypothetical protein